MTAKTINVLGRTQSFYWIGVIGLVVTLVTFSLVKNWEKNRLQNQFNKTASAYHALFLSHFNNYLSELDALKRLYKGSIHVNRDEFNEFTRPVLIDYPEINVFMWVPRVSEEDRRSFENNNWLTGLGQRGIWQHTEDGSIIYAKQRPVHFPVHYAEPIELYQSVIGVDLSAHPVLHQVLSQARDINMPVMVPPNIQIPKISKAPHITIVQPVYSTGAVLHNVEARQKAINGFVLIKINLAKSFEYSLINLHEKGINIDIIDSSLPVSQQLLYSYRPETIDEDMSKPVNNIGLVAKSISTSIPIVLAHRNWKFEFSPTRAYLMEHRQWLSLIVLFLGFIMTISFAAYVRATQSRTFAVQALVDERTSQLQETETKYKAIVDNAIEGIITINNKGVVESYNRAAESLFGFSAEEVVDNDINMLMPRKMADEQEGYLQNYFQSSVRQVGFERELEGRHKNGHVFPIEISVSEMSMNGVPHFIGIIRDITERKRIEKMKNEFVSTVSHELRTPLTSIRGALGLIKGGVTGKLPDAMQSMFDIANNNTERLLLLINDILDVQKIESGKMVLRMKSIALLPLLQSVVNDNKGYAEQYNVRFRIDFSSEYPWVSADPDRLIQVLNNLLSNAVKFSPSGEVVVITTERLNGKIRILVNDRGPGIPAEFQPKLFDKFTQSDTSDSRQTGGTGLGLFISKLIVEKHGGNIGFSSQQGVGTTFYIDLNSTQEATNSLEKEKYA